MPNYLTQEEVKKFSFWIYELSEDELVKGRNDIINFVHRLQSDKHALIEEFVGMIRKLEGLGEDGIDGKPIEWNVGFNAALDSLKEEVLKMKQ